MKIVQQRSEMLFLATDSIVQTQKSYNANLKRYLWKYSLAVFLSITGTAFFSNKANATQLRFKTLANPDLQTVLLVAQTQEAGNVIYRSEFRVNRQKYWFFATQYQGGAVVLNISKQNFREPRPLNIFKYQFISDIKKAPSKNANFYFTVRDGNGSNVPTTIYRLDLTNPNNPVVKKIRTFRS